MGCLILVGMMLGGCSKPIDSLQSVQRIALVAIHYNPNVYGFHTHQGIDFTQVFAPFSWKPSHVHMHERLMNAWLDQFIRETQDATGVQVVRSPMLMNTSLMQDPQQQLRFEHALVPYDPIDINNGAFLSGLSNTLDVDGVMQIEVVFAMQVDEKMLWDEYNDPHEPTVPSLRMQVKQGHKTSIIRTQITLTVVDKFGKQLVQETRFVDTNSDAIHITSFDLSYDGGVSPKLFQQGLNDWVVNWRDYL